MPSLTLGCCIVGALLYLADKSWSLTCGVCRRPQEDCVGRRETCFSFLDECGIFQSKNFKTERSMTRKSCVQGNSCFGPITSVDLGELGIIASKLTCCHDFRCMKARLLPFPTPNRTLNGKKCKACFAKERTFCLWEETISCKGDHTYCVELSGVSDWGGYGTTQSHDKAATMTEFAMKGCVNPAFCELFHEGSVYFATLFLMGRGSCKPASAKDTSIPSHRVSLLFQVFAGFLLVEIYA